VPIVLFRRESFRALGFGLSADAALRKVAELQAENAALKAENAALKAENAALKQQIAVIQVDAENLRVQVAQHQQQLRDLRKPPYSATLI
jgi:regulator of replication initiation timing